MNGNRIPEGTLERLIDKYGDADQHATLQQITGARPHAIKRGDEGIGEQPTTIELNLSTDVEVRDGALVIQIDGQRTTLNAAQVRQLRSACDRALIGVVGR